LSGTWRSIVWRVSLGLRKRPDERPSFGPIRMGEGVVKVLYIAGFGRSGSTILGNILGQLEGFAHVGEIIELWWGLRSRLTCGCGVPIAACNVWGEVLKEAYGGRSDSVISRMLHFRYGDARTRTFPRTTTSRGVHTLQRRLAQPLAELGRLYRGIQKVFECEVIVDSSKAPFYGYTLQLAEATDPYVLHLIRDPRATAYSWFRKAIPMPWGGPVGQLKSSLMWDYRNCVTELMGKRFRHRALRLRYEDFVADPRGSLQRILNFVGKSSSALPLQDEYSLNIKVQHTVCGNPVRFATGKIEVQCDDEWATRMKMYHKILATALTWPLLLKYGYPIRAGNLRERGNTARASSSLERRGISQQ
jgi:hypothetical protein